MKKSQFFQLSDLLEEIKEVDKMITLHLSDESNFMLAQYKAKKQNLIGHFIDLMVSPSLMSARSMHTIKLVIDKFYGEEIKKMDEQPLHDDLSKLELAIS